jgi:hypothetical protein
MGSSSKSSTLGGSPNFQKPQNENGNLKLAEPKKSQSTVRNPEPQKAPNLVGLQDSSHLTNAASTNETSKKVEEAKPQCTTPLKLGQKKLKIMDFEVIKVVFSKKRC